MKNPKLLTKEEYQRAHGEEYFETCEECDGSGIIDCIECGHESECDTCEMDGVVFTGVPYHVQVNQDLKDLKEWENLSNG